MNMTIDQIPQARQEIANLKTQIKKLQFQVAIIEFAIKDCLKSTQKDQTNIYTSERKTNEIDQES